MDRITNLLGVQKSSENLLVLGGSFTRCNDLIPDKETHEEPRHCTTLRKPETKNLKVGLEKWRVECQGEAGEHVRWTEAQRRTDAICRALFNTLTDPVLRFQKDGTILALNLHGCSETPLISAQMVGKTVHDVWPKGVARQVISYIEKALSENCTQVLHFRLSPTTQVSEWELRLAASAEDEVVGILRDITAQKRMEKRIFNVRQAEREQIGQDLHDSLGQHLSGIKFLCTALAQKAARQEPIDPAEAAYIEHQANVALLEMRTLAKGLCTANLEGNGLAAALQQLAHQVEQLNIRCHFQCEVPSLPITKSKAKHFYHIAQEAVNNAVKHGRAKNIRVELSIIGSKLTLKVRDDGIGFGKMEAKPEGIGLQVMNSRARKIGGTLRIEEEGKGGLCVTCSLDTLQH